MKIVLEKIKENRAAMIAKFYDLGGKIELYGSGYFDMKVEESGEYTVNETDIAYPERVNVEFQGDVFEIESNGRHADEMMVEAIEKAIELAQNIKTNI